MTEYENAKVSNKESGFGAWIANGNSEDSTILRPRNKWIYSFRIKNDVLKQDGQPQFYVLQKEHFPGRLSAITSVDSGKNYLFFSRTKYCKRPFTIGEDESNVSSMFKVYNKSIISQSIVIN